MPYKRRPYKDWTPEQKHLAHERVARYNRKHPERYLARVNSERTKRLSRDRKERIKCTVLTHYGPCRQLCCSWAGCQISDPDMLTIDHINNDGAGHRREAGGGVGFYNKLIQRNYPEGFQTLCWNHQWKKEMQRRRDSSK